MIYLDDQQPVYDEQHQRNHAENSHHRQDHFIRRADGWRIKLFVHNKKENIGKIQYSHYINECRLSYDVPEKAVHPNDISASFPA
jgi:hypothetical protein